MKSSFDRVSPTGAALGVATMIVWLALPYLATQRYVLHVLTLSAIFATFAIGWNFVTGMVGLKTFGHHALFAISAYGSALLAMNFGLSPWVTMWAGVALATASGLLIALPALRIRSVAHVAIVTLAFAEIVRILTSNLKDITRGEMGLAGIPAFDAVSVPVLGEIAFLGTGRAPVFYLASVLMIASFIGVFLIMRSRLGLAFIAIRNSQDAAESLGIHLAKYKLIAFAISSVIVGMSGACYAHYVKVLTPHSVAGIEIMILVIAMTLVGGIGTFFGPIVGAVVLVAGAETLREIGEYRLLVYGILIILCTRFLPNGLMSLKPGSAGSFQLRRSASVWEQKT